MHIYEVGGAVRDRLLGRPVQDRDWVVTGASPEDMRNLGYRQVGRDFPVFLHPETGEEYALARTERKTSPGYHGFAFDTSPEVSLEEDLARRDVTINAMAVTPEGDIIDPFGGQRDLRQGLLRHVSPAFTEDPVRILRVARFAARFSFRVAPETLRLMQTMVANGEVDALVPERVWAELSRALGEERPSRFFEVLGDCGARARLFPEIEQLYGVPQPVKHHPEVDTGIHTMMVLEQAARLSPDPRVRFAALTHDLGKGTTPREEWPSHHGHEERGVTLIRGLCRRYRIPNEYRELAVLAARYHSHCHRAAELRAGTLYKVLREMDALRRPKRFERFLLTCEADSRGRTGYGETPYPQADRLRQALAAAAGVDAASLADRGLTGPALGEALEQERIRAIGRLFGGAEPATAGNEPRKG